MTRWLALAAACVACSKPAPQLRADTTTAPTVIQQSSTEDVSITPAAALANIDAALSARGTTGDVFLNRPGVQVVESRRVSNGTPEIHDDWMDATTIESGKAQLLTGGRVTGSALRSAGEHRGGTITGGTTRAIAAGDFILIPAGTPHQFLVQRGDTIRYITVKVPGKMH